MSLARWDYEAQPIALSRLLIPDSSYAIFIKCFDYQSITDCSAGELDIGKVAQMPTRSYKRGRGTGTFPVRELGIYGIVNANKVNRVTCPERECVSLEPKNGSLVRDDVFFVEVSGRVTLYCQIRTKCARDSG